MRPLIRIKSVCSLLIFAVLAGLLTDPRACAQQPSSEAAADQARFGVVSLRSYDKLAEADRRRFEAEKEIASKLQPYKDAQALLVRLHENGKIDAESIGQVLDALENSIAALDDAIGSRESVFAEYRKLVRDLDASVLEEKIRALGAKHASRAKEVQRIESEMMKLAKEIRDPDQDPRQVKHLKRLFVFQSRLRELEKATAEQFGPQLDEQTIDVLENLRDAIYAGFLDSALTFRMLEAQRRGHATYARTLEKARDLEELTRLVESMQPNGIDGADEPSVLPNIVESYLGSVTGGGNRSKRQLTDREIEAQIDVFANLQPKDNEGSN